MRQTLFKTPHGPVLYGLANDNSDEDFYTVVTKAEVDQQSSTTNTCVPVTELVE